MNITIKRFRSLNANKVIGAILGFLIFMGFKSLIGAVHIDRIFRHGNIVGFIANIIEMFFDTNFIFFWFIPLSIMIIVFLSISFSQNVSKNIKYSFSFRGELTDLDYMSHIISLFILAVVPMVIYLTIIYTSFSDLDFYYSSSLGFYSLCLLIYLVVLCVLYINISVRRIKNIGFQGKYVPIVFILSSLLILIAGILMSSPEINPIIYMVLSFVVIILSVLVHGFQVLLIFLPEDFKNKLIKGNL